MTTVIDYHYSIPSAYTFPARPAHVSPPSMTVKHHPQPLNLSNALPRTLPPTTYLTPSIPSPSMHSAFSKRGGGGALPAPIPQSSNHRANSTGSSSLHRSTSNGSSRSSNAYVTTLRKQKATVWCDRAQREDSRFLAQQKAAKARAALEVARAAAQQGHHRGSESGSSVHRGKISHHRSGRKGNSFDHELSTNRSLVAGVPARLDIDDDSSDDEQPGSASGSAYGGITRRTNSGRSSINSGGQRRFTSTSSNGGVERTNTGTPQLQIRVQDLQNYSGYNGTNTSSPSTYSRTSSLLDTAVPEVPEVVDTPGTIIADPRHGGSAGMHRQDYFPVHRKSNSINRSSPTHSEQMLPSNPHSQSSTPPNMLPEGYMTGPNGETRPARPAAVIRTISSREPADLRRKGSIDDSRTMTMGRVRLFVANPDQ
ncbi:hypothetical protein H072_6254 [Dactylellina haptotyla CBS 200.50]|uniref:Uncharacterized protein n=1 Tax=Dactylellina haptotyla (strain CBS 200.50) TaxID=1284197 RepID=S8BKS0_DACHA|nr:hypothetical protein H072_6254 [Dactylellina haptotyla CBS 200.50]